MRLRNGKQYFYQTRRVLYWNCSFFSRTHNEGRDVTPCSAIRSHGICKSDWIKKHFKYRIKKVLFDQLPDREMTETLVKMPHWMLVYREKTASAETCWPLKDVLSGRFSVYFN